MPSTAVSQSNGRQQPAEGSLLGRIGNTDTQVGGGRVVLAEGKGFYRSRLLRGQSLWAGQRLSSGDEVGHRPT
jgi:hypothetical protein